MPTRHRLPISSRHAFALAFDLAVRRDLLHSIVVPLLLQTPWFVLFAMLPPLEESRAHLGRVTALTSLALVGQTFTGLMVSGMLRYRARSVFNTISGEHPESAWDCYSRSLERVPALYATEFLRYLALLVGGLFLYFPGLYLSFKLSMATETVVLGPLSPFAAFRRSFHLTEGRWERWLEMIAISVSLVLAVLFLVVVGFLSVPASSWSTWVAVGMVLAAAVLPIVQYAWTFFYLRLEESDTASLASQAVVAPIERSAAGFGQRTGAAPRLRLVESASPRDEDEGPEPR